MNRRRDDDVSTMYADINAGQYVCPILCDNAAGQHALVLARIAHRVLLICRSKTVKMDAVYQNQLADQPNIELCLGLEIMACQGSDALERVEVRNPQGEHSEIHLDGLFLAIGWQPTSQLLDFEVSKTADGYVKTDAQLMSSFPGLFAAGDVRDTDMFQVLPACADGARAAKYAAEYLRKHRFIDW